MSDAAGEGGAADYKTYLSPVMAMANAGIYTWIGIFMLYKCCSVYRKNKKKKQKRKLREEKKRKRKDKKKKKKKHHRHNSKTHNNERLSVSSVSSLSSSHSANSFARAIGRSSVFVTTSVMDSPSSSNNNSPRNSPTKSLLLYSTRGTPPSSPVFRRDEDAVPTPLRTVMPRTEMRMEDLDPAPRGPVASQQPAFMKGVRSGSMKSDGSLRYAPVEMLEYDNI